MLGKKVKPPFIPSVSSPQDVSNFDPRFTAKAISRESDEREVETTSKENGNVEEDVEESQLFPGFEYVSPEMNSGHLEDKILSLQDLRIRGYGNP